MIASECLLYLPKDLSLALYTPKKLQSFTDFTSLYVLTYQQ